MGLRLCICIYFVDRVALYRALQAHMWCQHLTNMLLHYITLVSHQSTAIRRLYGGAPGEGLSS